MKLKILAWILHHANKHTKARSFYEIKNQILKKHGEHVTYDIQYIEGKSCWSCGGTGRYTPERICYKCFGSGMYKMPKWNILERVSFQGYVFHQPYKTVYKMPEDMVFSLIEGYFSKRTTKYSFLCLVALYAIYDRKMVRHTIREEFNAWPCRWWLFKNWGMAIGHLLVRGLGSIPVNRLKWKFKRLFEKKMEYAVVQVCDDGMELPF